MRVFSLLTDTIQNGVVEVEFHSRFQIPSFQILGLPAPEIQEAKERIMAAFQSSNLEFPKKRVIINLSPASIKKGGTGHDLSIALKILSETHEEHAWEEQACAWGELSLEGDIKPVGRMAGLIEMLLRKFETHSPLLFLHSTDYASLLILLKWRDQMGLPHPKNLRIKTVERLGDLLAPVPEHPIALSDLALLPRTRRENQYESKLLSLSPGAERILKISLVGKHHVLLLGPKGTGKSESIRWYEALLPDSEPTQSWQRILMGERRGFPLDFSPPVRRVHASIKPSHLLGSFKERGYQPGELALAHGGLFIADEFMEWPRDSKECLREPLQSKKIFLTRIFGQIECPSDFQMVATGNLCPCGGLPPMFRTTPQSQKFKCSCKPPQIVHYLSKLSGPMLDRIDLTFVMHDPKSNTHSSSSLTRLRAEIEKARVFSMKHFGALPSELTPACLDQGPTFEKLLTEIMSLRTRHKILRVARSIQALEQSETLKEEHVFEAKCYRMPEIGEYYAS